MRSISAFIRTMPCQLLLRFGSLGLALLLTNGLVLLDMQRALRAAEQDTTSEKSAEEVEPAAEQSPSDETGVDSKEDSKKSASRKNPTQRTEVSDIETEKNSAKDTQSPDDEDQQQEIENEKAKAEEEAGAEVEVVDDSEEEEPEDAIEEETPIVEDTEKDAPKVDKRVIGATATIMEKKSELLFRARVDSGAKSCSLHIEDMKIENESDNMADNIGKVVRFNIKNGSNESHWLEAKIAGYVIIKTSNASDDRKRRYKVPLTFRYKDFEKTVLVTLNNREHMEFPLLLGRNFLKNDFLVDVDIESSD